MCNGQETLCLDPTAGASSGSAGATSSLVLFLLLPVLLLLVLVLLVLPTNMLLATRVRGRRIAHGYTQYVVGGLPMVTPSTWEDYPWLYPVRGRRITHGYTQYVGGGLPMVIPSTWEEDYPWLYPVRSFEGDVVGMCKVCKKHKTNNKYNQTTVWSQVRVFLYAATTVFVVMAKASNTKMH